MKNKLKKIPAPIVMLCYLTAIVLWFLSSAYGLVADIAAKSSGRLFEQQLSVADFELVNMHELETGSYISENDDPQMIWYNADGRTIRTLRMEAEFDRSPREMCLYYTTRQDEPFSVNKRVFASQQNDGSYLYTLPQGKIAALRLDPCSPLTDKPVTMAFSEFTMNQPAGVVSYFAPGWYGMFQLVVYPGLCAAALSLLRGVLVYYKENKKR